MLERKFYLEVRSPESLIYEGDVNSVRAPGMMGSFEILAGHLPFLTMLEVGEIRIREDDTPQYLATSGGVFEGRLELTGPCRIDGRVVGPVHSDDTLWIGPEADVEGPVHVQNLIVAGTTRGGTSGFVDFLALKYAGQGGLLGDLDGDGSVGPADLAILLGSWGPCGDCGDCPADLDGDCTVGAADLAILLGNWG